jgi:hypothetical protein
MISRRSFLSMASASALAIPSLSWSRQSPRPAIDAARLQNRRINGDRKSTRLNSSHQI